MINLSFSFLSILLNIIPITLYISTRNLIDIYDSISFFKLMSDEIES